MPSSKQESRKGSRPIPVRVTGNKTASPNDQGRRKGFRFKTQTLIARVEARTATLRAGSPAVLALCGSVRFGILLQEVESGSFLGGELGGFGNFLNRSGSG